MSGKIFIALFSGINVGGNRIVKMAELRSFFEELGFSDVATYVQSGNAVFRAGKGDAAALTKQIEAAFEKKWGFHSRIMVRDLAWFDNGEPRDNDPDRIPNIKKTADASNPIVRQQAQLWDRLRPHFQFMTTVTFANKGE